MLWRDRVRPPTSREVDDTYLTNEIRAIHVMSRGTYGLRRVHAELVLGRRLPCVHGRVERLMRKAGLQSGYRRL